VTKIIRGGIIWVMATMTQLSALIPRLYQRASDIPSGNLPALLDIVWDDIKDEYNSTFSEALKGVQNISVVSGTTRYALNVDFDYALALKNDPEGSYRYRLTEQQGGDRAWIDRVNNELVFPTSLGTEKDLILYYRKLVADNPETGDITIPLSDRLMKVLAYGCAYYWLSQKTGEDDHLEKLMPMFEAARADVFTGSITKNYGTPTE